MKYKVIIFFIIAISFPTCAISDVFDNSRFLTFSDENNNNKLQIFRQDAGIVFNKYQSYELRYISLGLFLQIIDFIGN